MSDAAAARRSCAMPRSPTRARSPSSRRRRLGRHLAEQALWRAAKIAPAAPWYQKAAAGGLLAQARAQGAYALVEHGVWADHGGAPLAVLVQGDPRMLVPVHVMRSFRVNHPAGKLFTQWITGPKGRAWWRGSAATGCRLS